MASLTPCEPKKIDKTPHPKQTGAKPYKAYSYLVNIYNYNIYTKHIIYSQANKRQRGQPNFRVHEHMKGHTRNSKQNRSNQSTK